MSEELLPNRNNLHPSVEKNFVLDPTDQHFGLAKNPDFVQDAHDMATESAKTLGEEFSREKGQWQFDNMITHNLARMVANEGVPSKNDENRQEWNEIDRQSIFVQKRKEEYERDLERDE